MDNVPIRRLIHQLSPESREVCSRLQNAGHEAYVVGGAIRDLIKEVPPGDFDVATSATPDQVKKIFRRVVPTGIRHGTLTVLVGSASLEVTTFRAESVYSDHRRPDAVSFVSSIEEDLSRRDFTFNGLAIDPTRKRFLDPYHGIRDLKAGVVRAIGRADERFAEDALRMLRAIRFVTQLDAEIESNTLAALTKNAPLLSSVSPERIRDELVKILGHERPGRGFSIMLKTGILDVILPELAEGAGIEQRGEHRFDVFEHSTLTCDNTPHDRLELRLAGLLHDVGKPSALVVDDQQNRTFHGHDATSAAIADDVLRRLRFPNATIETVTLLIREHMFGYTSEWTNAAVRRFIARVGEAHVDDLLLLRQADSFARAGEPADLRGLTSLRARINSILEKKHALTRADLKLNGHDLTEEGIPPGRTMGTVIDFLYETVLDDPSLNTKPKLLEIALRFYESRIPDEPDR